MFVKEQSGLVGPLFVSTLKSESFGSAGMLFGVSGNTLWEINLVLAKMITSLRVNL